MILCTRNEHCILKVTRHISAQYPNCQLSFLLTTCSALVWHVKWGRRPRSARPNDFDISLLSCDIWPRKFGFNDAKSAWKLTATPLCRTLAPQGMASPHPLTFPMRGSKRDSSWCWWKKRKKNRFTSLVRRHKWLKLAVLPWTLESDLLLLLLKLLSGCSGLYAGGGRWEVGAFVQMLADCSRWLCSARRRWSCQFHYGPETIKPATSEAPTDNLQYILLDGPRGARLNPLNLWRLSRFRIAPTIKQAVTSVNGANSSTCRAKQVHAKCMLSASAIYF